MLIRVEEAEIVVFQPSFVPVCSAATDVALLQRVASGGGVPYAGPRGRMRRINVAEDIVPIGHFKSHSSELLEQIRTTGRPLVLTQNGKAAAVVLSPEEFEALGYRELVRSKVAAGAASAERQGTISSSAARKRLKAKLLAKSRED
ncbi:MAG: type II toxin-antitoxin system Phd/YefM family antitoxin [Minicystis sp.]